jgi:hypothetical protein
VYASLRPPSPSKTERRCEASRLQEQIRAAVYQLLVPTLRRSVPSLPTRQHGQAECYVVGNQPRDILGEDLS